MTVEIALPPNMEKLVSAFLRDQPEIVALVDDRVWTSVPKGAQYPGIRVTQLDHEAFTGPSWGGIFYLQVEAFGGTKAQAFTTAATAFAVMSARLVGVHDDGVVNGVNSRGLQDLPDEDHEPAKPRFLFSSAITARPAATVPAS